MNSPWFYLFVIVGALACLWVMCSPNETERDDIDVDDDDVGGSF